MKKFFKSLKQENVYLSRHKTLKEAKIGKKQLYKIPTIPKDCIKAALYRTFSLVYNQDYTNIFDCCMKKEKIKQEEKRLAMLTVS